MKQQTNPPPCSENYTMKVESSKRDFRETLKK